MVPVTSTEGAVDAPAKPLRADAQRNYDKLVAAAREVFAERGAEGSLDEIAKRAGVGPGTLYRHFPTRDDLIDALMRDWTERVAADSISAVEAGVPARQTLERWLADLVKHMTLHRGAAAKLSAAMDDPSSPIYRKCQMLGDANDRVITYLIDEGALRDGVESHQVMRLVCCVATVVVQAGLDFDQVRPILDIVIDGILRDRATS